MKKTAKLIYGLLFSLVFFVGCQETIKEDLRPGLMGTDVDSNGIRDDIDKLIQQSFSETKQLKKAAEQKARALQKTIEAKNESEAVKAFTESIRATNCVLRVLSDDDKKFIQVSRELEAWTVNTKERLNAYLQIDKWLKGKVFPGPEEPYCD